MNRALRRKIVYWAIAIGAFVFLEGLWAIVLYGPHRLFGVSVDQSGNVVPWSLCLWIPATIIADTVCKGMGLSDAGKIVENLQRPPTGFEPALRLHPPEAQVRFPRRFWFALAAGFGFLAVFIWMLPALPDTISTPGTNLFGFGVGAFFGALALLFVWLPFGNGKFIGQIDSQGVTYHNVFTNHVALWENITTCEIVTLRDVFGKVTILVKLKNDAGRTLLNFSLSPGPEEEQTRFARALRELFSPA